MKQGVELGRVSGLFGVKGWVKVFSHTEPSGNILNYSPWYLQLDGRWQAFKLKQGKVHGKGIIAQLESCSDRDEAARLVGATIAVDRSQLDELPEHEFYWSDLIGLLVVTAEGDELGRVDHLLETGANNVLVIKAKDGQEHLIPYIYGDVVQAVDLAEGRLQVDWELED